MIESLLRNVFPVQYGLPADSVNVFVQRYDEPFTLSDPKACTACRANPNRSDRANCNEEILKVNNNGTEIAVVEFEKYITQFETTHANVSDRCDFLMTDSGMGHHKIVFCDLCCCEEQYVEPNTGKYPSGKRAKARQQMDRSIRVLLEESTTAVNLLTYPEKVCLFAWRDYNVPDTHVVATRGDVRSNVLAFGSTVSNLATQTTTLHQRMGYNFRFIQVKYPSVYNW